MNKSWSSREVGLLMATLITICGMTATILTADQIDTGKFWLSTFMNFAFYWLMFSILVAGIRKILKL